MAIQEELELGDRLAFTPTLNDHLREIGVDHDFKLGDNLVVLDRDDTRALPVLIGSLPQPSEWSAWVWLSVAEHAQEAYFNKYGLPHPASALDVPLDPQHLEHVRGMMSEAEWETLIALCRTDTRKALNMVSKIILANSDE